MGDSWRTILVHGSKLFYTAMGDIIMYAICDFESRTFVCYPNGEKMRFINKALASDFASVLSQNNHGSFTTCEVNDPAIQSFGERCGVYGQPTKLRN